MIGDLIVKIIILVTDILLVAAAVYGSVKFLVKKSPLYFRMLALAVVCYTGVAVFRLLYWLCFEEDFAGMGVTMFGILGCYLFLFSANFGQYDSFIDDRTPVFRKYRIAAFAAPVLLLGLLLYYTVGNVEDTTVFNNFVTGIGILPAAAASYYNFKHFLIPDGEFSFVRWIRRANLCALIAEFADMLRVLLYATVGDAAGAAAGLVVAGAFFAMLVFAERGRRSWLR